MGNAPNRDGLASTQFGFGPEGLAKAHTVNVAKGTRLKPPTSHQDPNYGLPTLSAPAKHKFVSLVLDWTRTAAFPDSKSEGTDPCGLAADSHF